MLAAVAVTIGLVTLPGLAGLVVGVLVTLALLGWRRQRQSTGAAARRPPPVHLPLTIDLLAGCIEAGADPVAALAVVARVAGRGLGETLAAVATTISLGSDPVDTWNQLADDPDLAALARAMSAAHVSGGSPVLPLRWSAQQARSSRHDALSSAARRAGVAMVGPLVLCFLPAFVLLGVVPVVVDLAQAGIGGVPG
ncbi:MAG: type II secretion system F family protein [Actinomycetes bacterium]